MRTGLHRMIREDLERYLELGSSPSVVFERHLARCPRCTRYLALFKEQSELLRSLGSGPPGEQLPNVVYPLETEPSPSHDCHDKKVHATEPSWVYSGLS